MPGELTLASDSDWKYVTVRRVITFIKASIDRGRQWVVFEPNADPLLAADVLLVPQAFARRRIEIEPHSSMPHQAT